MPCGWCRATSPRSRLRRPVALARRLRRGRAPGGSTWSTSTRPGPARRPTATLVAGHRRRRAACRSRPAAGSAALADVERAARPRAWTGSCSGPRPCEDPALVRQARRAAPRAGRRSVSTTAGGDGRRSRPRPRLARGRPGIDVGDAAGAGSTAAPLAAVVVTDIARDGTLEGPDLDGLAERARRHRACRSSPRAGSVGPGRPAPPWPAVGPPAAAPSLAGAVVGKAAGRRAAPSRRGGGSPRAHRPGDPVPRRRRAGRVVKGVQFVDLRDAGDPVELAARYDAEGADELVFLDITASPRTGATMVDVVAPHRRAGLHPLHGRRRRPQHSTTPGACSAPAPTRSASTPPPLDRPELVAELAAEFGAQCVVVAIDARRRRRRRLGGLHPRRAPADRHRRPRLGGAVRRPRGRRDPAHLDGPRRHPARLRPRAHPGGGRRRGDPGGRLGRRRARSSTWWTGPSRAAPTPCWPPRSSTPASTRSPRPRPTWPATGSRSVRRSPAGTPPGAAAGR